MKKIYYVTLFCFLTLFSSLAQQNNSPKFSCGVKDSEMLSDDILLMMKNLNQSKYSKARIAETSRLELFLAVTIDKSMYDLYNKDTEACKNRVYEVISEVSKVYERELNIKLTITYIEFWDSKNYSDIGEFMSYWQKVGKDKVKRDIPIIFKTERVDQGAAGIALTTYSPDYSSYSAVSSIGFVDENSVFNTAAHELGHNLGSPHTHSCKWPNGAIDLCSTVEGGCSNASTTEPQIGTIMSYCGERGFTFHPLCVALMRSVAEKILTTIKTKPSIVSISTENNNLLNASLSPFLNWNYSAGTDKYRIQISEDANFASTLIDSTLTYNQFQAYKLSAEKTYYWRINASNAFGESGWSNTAKFTTKKVEALPETPVVKWPLENTKELYTASLQFYPSLGATEYEIQFADEYTYKYYGFKDINLIKTSQTSFSIDLFADADKYEFFGSPFVWRVRAKNANGYSPWSRYYHFTRGVKVARSYPFNNQTNVPTNLPFSWDIIQGPIAKNYQLQVSTSNDFSKNLINNNLTFNQVGKTGYNSIYGTQNIQLQPNTTYYYRLRDADKTDVVWVNNMFSTTNSATESNKWKFINESNSSLQASRLLSSYYHNIKTGRVWLGENGLKSTDGVNWYEDYNALNTKGEIKNSVNKIASDSKDNIWFNNSTQIVKYAQGKFTVYNNNNSRLGRLVYGLNVDKNDNVYTYCYDNGVLELFKFDGSNWSVINAPFTRNTIPSLTTDYEGNLWSFTGAGGNCAKLVNDSWVYYKIDESRLYYVLNIYPDRDGNLWAVSPNNIGKLTKNGEWTYSKPNFPTSSYNDISITFDKNNVPYLYFISGRRESKIYKFVNNAWVDLAQSPLPIETSYSNIRDMHFDNKNRLWIATSYNGIFIYDEQGKVKSQSITADPIAGKKVTSAPFDLKATATSNLPVSFTLISGPATISGSKVTLNGQLGKVVIRASQAGNEEFEPATNVELAFDVKLKDSQSITIPTIATKAVGDAPFSPNATTNSGLPITYTVVSGPATIANGLITVTGAGKVTIKASQAGNDDYSAATDATITFCVTPTIPTIASDATNPFILKSTASGTIQWYFNGTKITGATATTYTSVQNGTYRVEVANPEPTCPNAVSKDFALLVLANEADWTTSVNVFPNPVSSNVVVELPAGIQLKKLTIFDLNGKKLLENSEEKLNINHLPNGMMLLDIQTNKGNVLRKIVKE